MEACVDSVESAVNAEAGGAVRLEICSSLAEGGLTPSSGLVTVIMDSVCIPCNVLIRPRAGDFVYSDLEMRIMEYDMETMISLGVNGLVFGCLDVEGNIDQDNARRLVTFARSKKSDISLTFHRAIDMTRDILSSARTVVNLGFHRILTSGGEQSARAGVDIIRELVREVGQDIIIMPGAGINANNLQEILSKTNCPEFHASAREVKQSEMKYQNESCSMGSNGEEYRTMITSVKKVQTLVKIFLDFSSGNT